MKLFVRLIYVLVHRITKTTNSYLIHRIMAWYIAMMTSSNGNVFRATGHLCGEFTDPHEFPAQRPVTRSFVVFFVCVWINDWVNNREAGDLRCYRAHYDVTVMRKSWFISMLFYDSADCWTYSILWSDTMMISPSVWLMVTASALLTSSITVLGQDGSGSGSDSDGDSEVTKQNACFYFYNKITVPRNHRA